MFLVYDSYSNSLSLTVDDEVLFLGPIAHAVMKLKSYGFEASVAQEAVARAVFLHGDVVDLDNVVRMN